MQNILKLNMRGPWTSNVTVKFIASPFNSFIANRLIANMISSDPTRLVSLPPSLRQLKDDALTRRSLLGLFMAN